MQRVGPIVGYEVVGLAIQCELRTANSIGVAANYRAEVVIRADCLIFAQGLQAKHDVAEAAPSGQAHRSR